MQRIWIVMGSWGIALIPVSPEWSRKTKSWSHAGSAGSAENNPLVLMTLREMSLLPIRHDTGLCPNSATEPRAGSLRSERMWPAGRVGAGAEGGLPTGHRGREVGS